MTPDFAESRCREVQAHCRICVHPEENALLRVNLKRSTPRVGIQQKVNHDSQGEGESLPKTRAVEFERHQECNSENHAVAGQVPQVSETQDLFRDDREKQACGECDGDLVDEKQGAVLRRRLRPTVSSRT